MQTAAEAMALMSTSPGVTALRQTAAYFYRRTGAAVAGHWKDLERQDNGILPNLLCHIAHSPCMLLDYCLALCATT